MEKGKKRFPKILIAVLALALVYSGLLVGCNGESEQASSAGTGTASSAGTSAGTDTASSAVTSAGTASNKIFVDDCDRSVEVPEKITTTIASGNLAQIVLYALAPEALLANSGSWTDEEKKYVPRQYWNLPEVGSFFGQHDLNYEEIAKLKPEIIIDVGEDKPTMESDLDDITKKTGIPAVHITANFDDMDEAFTKLGDLMGRQDEAKALAGYSKEAFDLVERTMDNVEKKKTVLYCAQEDGLNVLARDSYHSQIVDLIGENVAVLKDPSSQGTGNEVNMEQMINWDPDVILFAPNSYFDYAADDPAWQMLRAIKKDQYYQVPAGPYNWMGSPPSSNRILGLLWMTKLFYPEKADYDMREKTVEYYRLFYHHQLTDEEYEALVANSITKREQQK